jgi:hypothetical protein
MRDKRLTGDTEPPDKRGSSVMSARIEVIRSGGDACALAILG